VNSSFIIALDDAISRLACLSVLAGALCIRVLGWEFGWVAVAFGVLSLWLAHQFAIAPLCPYSVPSPSGPSCKTNVPDRFVQD